MSLADYIQEHLRKNGVTLYSVSKKSGITYGYLDRVSKGFKGNLTRKTQEKLAYGLGVDVAEIGRVMAREPVRISDPKVKVSKIPVVRISDLMSRLPISGDTLSTIEIIEEITLPNMTPHYVGVSLDMDVHGYEIGDIVVVHPTAGLQENMQVVIRHNHRFVSGQLIKTGPIYQIRAANGEILLEAGKNEINRNYLGAVKWLVREIR
ncbi:hypothetical protein EBR96_09085 [bacterium]|nr:hypothetical protein [bacterium]